MSLGEMNASAPTEPEAPANGEAPQEEPVSLQEQVNEEPAEGDAPNGAQPEDDYDDVEYDGEYYRLPKKLKDAVLRQADYTKKTQEVAEQRRALEARDRELVQQAEALRTDTQERARLVALEDTIKEYANVDWDKWEQQDPLAAQAGWRKFQQLRDAIRAFTQGWLRRMNSGLMRRSRVLPSAWRKPSAS